LNFVVKSKKSNIGTFRDLCVICSILPLTHFSPTNPIPHLMIQKTFPIKSATFNIALISGNILGIFGAGGNTGNCILMVGMNDGGSGNVGGSGITGIVGNDIPAKRSISKLYIISRLTSIVGGSGRLGNCGNGILSGTRFIFGNVMSIPSSICERSI
jgi:hypothetical protein